MKFKNPLLVVADMEKAKAFYLDILGLRVIMDFGANITLTGGVCLQSLDSWLQFIDSSADKIAFGGGDAEIYFEEDDFDAFLLHLDKKNIEYVHPVMEHSWGQRVVRFYDPDHHIIEVGENMRAVCQRFLASGMTVEQVARRMDVPVKYVKACCQQ